jgi:hypothetical protein
VKSEPADNDAGERFPELGADDPLLGQGTDARLVSAAAVATAFGLGSLAWLRPAGGWALGAVMLGLFAAIVVLWRRKWRSVEARLRAARAVVVRGDGLGFDAGDGGFESLAGLDGPFGVTLFANRARTRAVLVVTTPATSCYVGALVREGDQAICRELLAAAFTVANDERALDAAAPDGAPFVVSGGTLQRLYERLCERDPHCTGRLFLSDARGAPVVLDGASLVSGPLAFDLSRPLDWQGLLFREGQGVASVYQGTQVRQNEHEAVFVALLPALASPSPGDTAPTGEPSVERAVVRDQSLLNVVVADPPPPHLRVAIERLFMLPLRAALSHAPVCAQAPSGTGERSHPAGGALRAS